MKKIKFISIAFLTLLITVWACQDVLEKEPYGSLNSVSVDNKDGINALLIGVYGMLDLHSPDIGSYQVSPKHWVLGDVASDDALKGSEPADQDAITQMELYDVQSTNNYLELPWKAYYEAVSRSNIFIRTVSETTALTEEEKPPLLAEGRFLRAHFYFELKKLWDKVPYIDENTENPGQVANDKDIWPMIEEDFAYAVSNLPEEQTQVGRVTKTVAQAYLAKTYIFQEKNAEAKPLLEIVIKSDKYELATNFRDLFDANKEASQKETIFAIQASVGDGSVGRSGNYAEILNYAQNGPGGCCGFFQPSQDLVNAFQTKDGLPMTEDFYDVDVANDDGLDSTDAFTPDSGEFDPRLDWTVGRRGIPYLDWGDHPGKDWIRNQDFGGPYLAKKFMTNKADQGTVALGGSWGELTTAVNYSIIRYADVLLWAAEVEAKIGSLTAALGYVNQVRNRAAETTYVKKDDGSNAANYVIKPYTSFADKDIALKAIKFERRLEFALEGHRFFDLVRWGDAQTVLNAYATREGNDGRDYLLKASFDEGDGYYPIPQNQIDLSIDDSGNPVLK